ncbi:anti-sigma factor [Psychroserpens sp. XS_ASV72]|uniref:anti-sigma factor domain-containing protein n=1 Tax=Psychroserpens sp. XS_ASV72 TaxID=3241293 RepID=UPI00351463A1
MEKTHIIEQGYLELYVLGELNESDTQQVEAALIAYPELKTMLDVIEANFEKLGFENAVEPRPSLKNELLNNLNNSKIKQLKHTSNKSNIKPLGIAASIAALLLVGSVYLFLQWNTSKEQLKLVEDQNRELNIKIDQLSKDFEESKALLSNINNPNTKKYVLLGNDLMPNAKVISYVNDEDKTVFINTTLLPELDEKQDYQMWADVNGEMINMGIIKTEEPLLAMNYIENSESLNITIEPAGGSDHPTVSNLITNIYIR